MIIFVHGPDTFRSREKVTQLKERFVREVDTAGTGVVLLSGKEVTAPSLNEVVAPQGLFSSKRMIIVRDFVKEGKKQAQEELQDLLPSLSNGDNIVVFWDGKIDKRSGLYKKLSKEKYSFEFSLLEPHVLQRWILDRVGALGGQITGDAAQLIGALVGNDLWMVSSEVDKLVAYKKEETIGVQDVRELVIGKYEEQIFALSDAVATRDSALALQLLERELSGGMNPIYLHTMLVRQFRILIQLKGLLAESSGQVNQQVAAKKLSLHPFVVKKSLPQVRRFTFSELRGIYRRLLTIDVKLKSTKVPAEVMFDLLVVGN